MDNKSYHQSLADTSTHNKDHYLWQINKLSRNISKPIIKKPTFFPSQNHTFNFNNKHILPLPLPQPQPPPPVYNVTKNDFKDLVQKLTGSPSQSHHPISTPPPLPQPIQKPKPPSSRLQRIRPPPLAQISSRPTPPLLNEASAVPSNTTVAPFSPLPPLPSVRVAAESPVTAYMRFLKSSVPSSPVPLLSPSTPFSPSSGPPGASPACSKPWMEGSLNLSWSG